MPKAANIKDCADALARLDVASALAHLAGERDYTRPQIDDSHAFVIEGGRHPVVEQALSRDGTPFVANSCDLSPPQDSDAGRIWLITGPNMAGKSTFLRQNALIAILAQMGSFVPAKAAHIGIVDRLFSRVGAADDLARGRSTFMVEMVETAAILNQAGERALVILDEIGRGTATFDGLSIAWATVEHLHDVNKCRALFATHFHELTALAGRLDRLHNATVRVKEWQGEVVFLHEVVAGAADRSYGIQVAKLAGLPASVIDRAKVVLAKLEQEDRAAPKGFEDLPLFAVSTGSPQDMRQPAGDILAAALVSALAAINPDDLSPREAMEALYRLKEQAAKASTDGLGRHSGARDSANPESRQRHRAWFWIPGSARSASKTRVNALCGPPRNDGGEADRTLTRSFPRKSRIEIDQLAILPWVPACAGTSGVRTALSHSSWPGLPFEERRASHAYVPAIHVFIRYEVVKTWMPGIKPGMTLEIQ